MKKLLLKVKLFLISLFASEKAFAKFITDHADEGIEVVNKLKAFMDNPITITLMALIPGKYAGITARVKDRIEDVMNKVIEAILVAKDIEGKYTFNERLRALVNYLNSLSPEMKKGAFLKIASLYAQHSSNELAQGHMVDTAVQARYLEVKEKLS